MAIPPITWTGPVGSYANGDPLPTTDSHKLNNDLVCVSDKFGTSGTFAAGQPNAAKSGKYMVAMNDVARTDNLASPPSSSGGSDGVPAHSAYVYTDQGHISLNGGVFELHPFSSGIKGGTTTYTDFGGSGRSPYPESYTTLAPGTSNNPGVPICGTTNYQNVESLYTYTTGTMTVGPNSTGTYGTGATPATEGDQNATPAVPATAATLSGAFISYWGVHTGTPARTLYSLTGDSYPQSGWTSASFTSISEEWFVGQSFQQGGDPLTPHKGAINFKVSPDTECEIISGNDRKTVTGTANWANGQSRTVTITATDHGLVDSNNRIYITGASNNAINGIWNVATVTNSSQFTTTIFAANCEDGGVDITGLNIVTYDGIDKTGGVLRSSSGTITTVYQRRDGTYGNPSAEPPTSPSHNITYWYDGPHGVASSGEVSVQGTVDYDFTGSVTRSSGTRLVRSIGPGSGYFNDTTTIWSGGPATVYAAAEDHTVIAGGMFGNNKVIIKGSFSPTQGTKFIFCGNSSTAAVHTGVILSSTTRARSMFTDAKLNVADSGRVYTSGAPSTQPTDSSGGFDGVNGGMAPIDDWCPHYMHGRIKAQERNDLTEVLKANTSAFDASEQMLNSPLIDESGDLTTYMHPRFGFHQTIHFSLQAFKNTVHTTTGRTHAADSNDYVTRDFHINVHQNMKAAKNDFIVTYPTDSDNNFEVANTDTAMKDLEANTFQSNYDWLANSYSNGTFSNL